MLKIASQSCPQEFLRAIRTALGSTSRPLSPRSEFGRGTSRILDGEGAAPAIRKCNGRQMLGALYNRLGGGLLSAIREHPAGVSYAAKTVVELAKRKRVVFRSQAHI